MYNSLNDVSNQLLFGQNQAIKSTTSKLPLPYHLIPGEIRQILAKIIFKPHAKRVRQNKNNFPSTYYDNSVDVWLSKNTTNATSWKWPSDKKCAIVLSHDTDTPKQEKGIQLLVNIAQKYGIKNTFTFVGKNLNYYHSFLNELISQGVEIALHDYIHDNQVAFLEKEEILRRLLRVSQEKRNEYGITGFRSPSWYVSTNLWDALDEIGYQYDMSTLDTWPLFSKTKNYGVCTFFPYIKNNLVIIPSTIPIELPWYLGYKIDDTFQFWKNKIDIIANSGGLIMFNAHPDKWFCGNKKAIIQVERCLDYIMEFHNPAVLSGNEVAQHTLKMKKEGAMHCIESVQKIHTPFHTKISV